MAELMQKERLQPSLLDRLTDDEPERAQEPREKRVLSLNKLRECVLRDLSWLLNSGNSITSGEFDDYPLVAKSVINYGMPDIAGSTASSVDVGGFELTLVQLIKDFEPRILPHTVKVRVIMPEDKIKNNSMTLEIEGQLWAQPAPLHLILKTDIDLESGNVNIRDYTSAGGV